jgi:type IV pilus assembly protein PilB
MSVLSEDAQRQVEDALIKDGLLQATDLATAKNLATKEGKPLLSYLIASGKLTDEDLTRVVAEINDVPYVNLSGVKISPSVLELLPQEIATRYMAIPLGEMENRLVVAMLDAENVQAADFLSNKIGKPIKVYKASEKSIREALRMYDANISRAVSDTLQVENTGIVQDKGGQDNSIKTIVQDSPISKALNSILEYAAVNRASDIHMEPLEHEFKIRCRIDGVLREIMRLSKSFEPPIVSRIKILSSLKIDEHRIPQDGQFTVRVAEKNIDLRIAISPVVWGEQIVIRLLDKSGTSLKLEQMGYMGRSLRTIREGLKRPNGMILTSGPTGSGKSTSLYALIQEIKSDEINIVTLEDPVEYKMDGINQIQVNAEVGLTFASGLRSILRQDPDVIMVGEIRDKETATLAIQAALTGHLVFSTLHTNSAAGILPRLLDMGIEPFLIASTVHTVIGQRLVRRITPDKEEYLSTASETQSVVSTLGHLLPKSNDLVAKVAQDLGYQNLPLSTQKAYTLFKGKPTPEVPSGFKGRLGIYEVFEITEKIQDLIIKRSTSGDIHRAAVAQGMVSMREDGYLKALAGMTSVAEINRVAAEELD